MPRLALRRRIISQLMNLKAAVSRKGFYCNSLKGDSPNYLTIHSDMVVSCNCNDSDGYGHIGDLSTQSLSKILSGKIANSFRRSFAKGKLPIPTCSVCYELKWTKRNTAHKYIDDFHMPKNGITIENTSNCNLTCIHCKRASINKIRKKNFLDLNEIKKISLMIKENEIGKVFYFSLGEPFLSRTILEELEIIKSDNPDTEIMISTNGMLINNENKIKAALRLDHLVFSIDGSDNESLVKYQKGGSFDTSYLNMKNLVNIRNSNNSKTPLIEWKYVLFRWNAGKERILKAIRLAKEAKVDVLNFHVGSTRIYNKPFGYYFTDFFKKIGEPTNYGRKIDFRKTGF